MIKWTHDGRRIETINGEEWTLDDMDRYVRYKRPVDWGSDKIDWTKPLKCVHPEVYKVEYIQSIDNGVFGASHICKLFYNNRSNRWYYRIYYSNGKSADACAEDISIKNDVRVWGKSAWMVLSKEGNVVSTRHKTRDDAERWVRGTWYSSQPMQYVRYDYTEQR